MPFPSSGTLSLLDIQNEFGGANPIRLSEYYDVESKPDDGQTYYWRDPGQWEIWRI